MKKWKKNKYGFVDFGSERTFGFKETFEKATKALHENYCDMHEGLYQYAIVEEINTPTIHPDVDSKQWFEFDENKEGFFEIEEPNLCKNYCNFAVC